MRTGVKALLVASALLVAACKGNRVDGAATPGAVPAGAITKVTENGPVKATVQLWPEKPALSDVITLRLTVETAPGVTVDLPFQEDALGRFKVSSYDRSESRAGDKLVQTQTYELQAPSSGRHRIPPLRLEVNDARGTSASGSVTGSGSVTAPGSGSDSVTAAGSGSAAATGSGSASGSAAATAAGPTELLTEEIPIQVDPVSTDRSDAELRPTRPVLDPSVGGQPLWLWITLGAVGLALIIAAALFLRWRSRRAIRAKVSAYDAAVAKLDRLESRGAPTGDDADAWFVELSAIVRRYLEGRYEIRAPELTTQEFLLVASRAPELTAAHKELLSSFLERCDRVKFAGYRPDAEESIATLRAARGFIEDTRLVTVAAIDAPKAA